MEYLAGDSDFTTSLDKALDEIDPRWRNYPGVLIAGSHKPSDIERKLKMIKRARTKGIPFLGICWGMQLMAIEYARNVLGIPDAITEETGESGAIVVRKLPERRVGIFDVVHLDGEMRKESHWHQYHVSPAVFDDSWRYSSTDGVVEIASLSTHPFFVGAQFHPEYQSDESSPHPVLKQFIDICKRTAE